MCARGSRCRLYHIRKKSVFLNKSRKWSCTRLPTWQSCADLRKMLDTFLTKEIFPWGDSFMLCYLYPRKANRRSWLLSTYYSHKINLNFNGCYNSNGHSVIVTIGVRSGIFHMTLAMLTSLHNMKPEKRFHLTWNRNRVIQQVNSQCWLSYSGLR
jgi:hypothetical protein